MRQLSTFSLSRQFLVRSFQILVILLIFLSPIIFLSQVVVEAVAGDNKNYKAFFEAVRDTWSMKDAYYKYTVYTGASEPISFAFFYMCSALGMDYGYSVLMKNIAILFVLWRLICRHFSVNFLFLTLILYLSTDYYLFRLLAELQRLGLAALFLLASILFFDRKGLFLLLGLLSHLQVALFFPLLIFVKRNRVAIFLALAIIGVVFSVSLRTKIMFYLEFRPADISKFFLLSVPFLALCLSTGRKTFKLWISLTAAFFIVSSFLGTDRIIVMYWEILVVACFVTIHQKGWQSKRFIIFYVFIYGFAIPYNIFRIFFESADLLSDSSQMIT